MWLLLALLCTALAYVAYAHWAWRDLAVAELAPQYASVDEQTAQIDGVPIRYRLQGPDAPVLVLIHNHFLEMRMWDQWLATLRPQFRVLRYDLSGHGLTGPDPSGVYTVKRDVDLLTGLLDQLGITDVAVVGSSLGGNIAFNFAAEYPQRCRALVLINSGGLKKASGKPGRSGKDIPQWADFLMPLLPPWALHKFLFWMAADDQAITRPLQQRFVDMWRRAGNRQAELARLRQFETDDPDPILAKITAPTLIMWGQENPQLPAALASEFERKLSAATTVERIMYPGTGHLLPLERPQRSVDDVFAFLQKHLAAEKSR